MTHSPSICLRISVLPQTMYTLSRTDISPNKPSPAVSGKHVLMSALQIHLTMRCWHRHTEEKCLQLWVCWPPEFRRFPELDQAGCLHIQHPVFLRKTHFCRNIPFPEDHNRHAAGACAPSNKRYLGQCRYPDTTACQTDCFCSTAWQARKSYHNLIVCLPFGTFSMLVL